MDLTALGADMFKLSPIVGLLALAVYVLWNANQKKDETIMTTVKEHKESQEAMNTKMIEAFNQNTASHVQMASSLDNLGRSVNDRLTNVENKLSRNGRSVVSRPAKPAQA